MTSATSRSDRVGLLNSNLIQAMVVRMAASPLLELLTLSLSPIILLSVNDSWTFLAPYGWIDPYLYTGFFIDLKGLLHSFGHTYYASRLPWLLLGNAAHRFSPDTANIVLRLTLFYGGVFPLFVIVQALWKNRLAATIAALLLGAHTHFLSSIGWDYVDGAGLVAMLIALALLTTATQARRWEPLLFGAGVMAMFPKRTSARLFLEQ